MADTTRDDTKSPPPDETSDTEHDRVRSSNDRDQALEREGMESEHNRGYDEASSGSSSSRGRSDEKNLGGNEVDPDSPESDIDRDDTIDEP